MCCQLFFCMLAARSVERTFRSPRSSAPQQPPRAARLIAQWVHLLCRKSTCVPAAFAVRSADDMEKRLQHFQVPYSRFTVPDTNAAQLFLLDVEGEALQHSCMAWWCANTDKSSHNENVQAMASSLGQGMTRLPPCSGAKARMRCPEKPCPSRHS